MNLHRVLMGDRWRELPAQTVLDEKVSKYIGLTLLGLMITVGIQTLVITHQSEKIHDLES